MSKHTLTTLSCRLQDNSTETKQVVSGRPQGIHDQQPEEMSRQQLAKPFKKSMKANKESVIKEKSLPKTQVSVSEPLDSTMQQLAETINGLDTDIGQQLDKQPDTELKPVTSKATCKFLKF